MHPKSPLAIAACVLIGAFFWAAHVAIGMFDLLIDGPGHRRSMILGSMDRFTDEWLVAPLGEVGAMLVIVLVGALAAGSISMRQVMFGKKKTAGANDGAKKGWSLETIPHPSTGDAAFDALMKQQLLAASAKLKAQNADARNKKTAVDAAEWRNVRITPLAPWRTRGVGRSYLGGAPELPDGMDWPTGDGGPCAFIGQIDLAELPDDLWSGLGPREGRLLFFEDAGARYSVKVFHLLESGKERPCTHDLSHDTCFRQRVPPRLSIALTPYTASAAADRLDAKRPARAHEDFLDLQVLRIVTLPDGAQAPWYDFRSLLDANTLRPFDWPSLMLLANAALDELEAIHEIRTSRTHNPNGPRLRDVEALRGNIQELKIWILKAEDLQKAGVDFAEVSEALIAQAKEISYDFFAVMKDGSQQKRTRKIFTGRKTPRALAEYRKRLEHYRLTAEPGPLTHSRDEAEAKWKEKLIGETGRMGALWLPTLDGDETEASPDADRLVLLALPTSRLFGWTWGDAYSLAVLIKRADLERGDFSKVETHFIDY